MDLVQATADPDTLIRRASELIDHGRTGAARPLLAAARRMVAPTPDLALLSARLALREGMPDAARGELDAAIAAAPAHAGLRLGRAELRHATGDLEGATRDAAEAVVMDRTDPAAKALLGTLMLDLGRPADARACLAEAAAQTPASPAVIEALALAQERCGDPDTALETLLAGIAAFPATCALRNAAVMLCIRARDFTRAADLAEQARKAGIADACLFGLKGHALSSLGRHDEAAIAYQDALKLGPEDPYVRHLVAASGALPEALRAPEDYVRVVFDGYADRFESHLIGLGYRTPGVIRARLLAHPALRAGRPLGPLLDLGCGTGLMALAIGDLDLGPLTGVDLSPRMLAHARAKQLYADLIEADLVGFLGADQRQWPVIIAADVLCYFGALDDVMPLLRQRLAPGGWVILSLEELLPDRDGAQRGNGDWALLRQGRYAHTEAYARRMATQAGLVVRELAQEVARHEAAAPVAGLVLVLERPDDA